MKITLVTVGKIKEKFYTDAIAEYAKRLSRYCKLEIIQVADEKTPDKASEAEEQQIKDKEGKRILEQIKDGETPSRELGELAKVMKQAVEIRQELQEEHGGQETGVRVVFEREAEEFSE